MSKVYALVDGGGLIRAIGSDDYLIDTKGLTLIDEGDGDRYRHAQAHYLDGPLTDQGGVPRYRWDGTQVVERPAADIQADIDAIPPPPPDPAVVTQKAAQVMFRALAQKDVISSSDALDNAGMFPVWADSIGHRAEAGSYWRHADKLYRVNAGQGHTIQADWAPDKAASLFSLAANPTEEWPEWIQPTGAHNAYAKGDKVSHNGKHWISTANPNTWEPGVYGWTVSD